MGINRLNKHPEDYTSSHISSSSHSSISSSTNIYADLLSDNYTTSSSSSSSSSQCSSSNDNNYNISSIYKMEILNESSISIIDSLMNQPSVLTNDINNNKNILHSHSIDYNQNSLSNKNSNRNNDINMNTESYNNPNNFFNIPYDSGVIYIDGHDITTLPTR